MGSVNAAAGCIRVYKRRRASYLRIAIRRRCSMLGQQQHWSDNAADRICTRSNDNPNPHAYGNHNSSRRPNTHADVHECFGNRRTYSHAHGNERFSNGRIHASTYEYVGHGRLCTDAYEHSHHGRPRPYAHANPNWRVHARRRWARRV